MMPALTEEETNYLRLAILVIKLSPQAVRILFDNRFPPVNLSYDLGRKKGKLQSLFGKRIINQAQWDLLYPTSGTTAGSTVYDLTLLICLLRNIATPPVSKPVTGFDQLPPDYDLSEGADMARIKYYRNLIAHHTDAELSYADFNVAWIHVTEAIGRLGGGRYNQDCIDLRVAALDGSDKEVYREVVKTQQALEQLKKELKEETVPWNVLRIHEIKIKSWEEKDKKYANTAVTDTIMDGIEKHQCVLITGNSGCGKSALARHTALKLREKGYRILPVIKPGEITLYQNPNIQQVLVCDDICGKYYADNASIEEWIRYEDDLKLIFENVDIKLLLTSRLIVSQDEHFKMMSFLSALEISLHSPQNRFTVLEKKAMLKNYLLEDEEIEVSNESMESQDCFPLLCQLFGENESLRIDPNKFFSQPFEEYAKDLEKLKLNNPLKYSCLALLVMFEDEISEDILLNLDINPDIQDEIDAVCQVVGIPRGTSRYRMKEELMSLENIYCRNIDGKIKSLHDKMFDFLSAKIGPTLGPCLLKYSSYSFVRERIRLISSLPYDDENVIVLPQSQEQTYFDRMYNDIMSGNIKDVFFNKQMQQTSFEDAMVRHLSRMNVDELYNFIKKEGVYSQHSTKFLQRSKSMLDPFTYLGKIADDLDEVAKFHLSYTYSLLYQENICTFHWILAQGLYRVFLHVEERLPEFVKKTVMDNYNLCISLSILEQKTEILEVIFRKYPHNTSEDDENDKRYYPLFLFVCFTGNLKLVKFLYNLGLRYLNPGKTETGESAVWLASFACQFEVLKFLVSKNLDINSQNNVKATPLFIASQRGHTNIVEYLLLNGANVNLCKENGTSPLFVASQEGHTEIVQLLLENHANVNLCKGGRHSNELRGASPLFIACKNGHVGIVQMLLSHEADIELSTERGKTPLLVALQNGHTNIVHRLIRKGADINHQMDNGLSPLTVVSGIGQGDVVRALLDSGADIDIKREENYCQLDGPVGNADCFHSNIPSPLTMAAFNNHLEIIKTLLDNGADINYRGVEGATALFEAVQKGHLDMAKFLISKNASVNISTLKNRSPLFVAVQRRFEDIVMLLLRNNADVNLCREDGVSPLLMATLHNNTKIVQILLQHKANPDLSTTEGLFPLIFAAKRGNLEILKHLIESGATVNCQNNLNQTVLWMAAYHGNIECVRFLLEKQVDVNSIDTEGESVLLSAIRTNNLALIQMLIEVGSDVNNCNNKGITPLIRAVQCGSLQTIECLITSKADINSRADDGQSALMVAVDESKKDIVESLLRNNANVNDADSRGLTVLWKAVYKGNLDITTLLLDSEANTDVLVEGKTVIELANEMGHTEITNILMKRQGRLKQLFKTFGWITSVYSKVNNVL